MYPLEKLTDNTKLAKQHLECKIRKNTYFADRWFYVSAIYLKDRKFCAFNIYLLDRWFCASNRYMGCVKEVIWLTSVAVASEVLIT